jgi:hypothetical protein
MDLCEALIAAQVQLAWGSDPAHVARAIEQLRFCAPDSELLYPLERKLQALSAG